MNQQTFFTLLFPLIAIAIIIIAVISKQKVRALKQNGIKVIGTVIKVENGDANPRERLGGNIYAPTVQFTTVDSREITGKPITGFISQTEITAPFNVYVYYNSGNPEEFYVEF